MATNEIGSVSIGIEADTRRFRQQMQEMGNRGGSDLNRTMNRAFKAGGIIASIKLIGDAISSVTRKAMQFEASTQQVDRIFGENSQTIKNWARTNAAAFNMSTNNALKFSATYGGLISNITDSQVENAQLTQEMLKQTAVIASGTGRTMEDVGDRIRSGLLGSTEAIEDLFINVNVSMLESTEAFRKFAGDKSWAQLDFKTQQQIRLNAILEQSYKMYGNEVNKNTSSSLARLSAIMSNISLNIGQVLKPVIDSIINSMITLATSIERVTGAFAKMVNRLTGTKEQTKAMADTSKVAAQGQEELGKAVAGAGKEAKKGVAGFDEVNQLQDQMAGGGAGAGGIAGAVEDIDNKPLEKTNDELSEFEKKIKGLMEEMSPTFDKLIDAFTDLGDSISDLWNSEAIVKFRAWLGQKAKFGIARSLEFLTGAIEILAGVIDIITGILNGDWTKAFVGAEKVVQGLWDIFESTAITVLGEDIKTFLDEFETKWKAAWDLVKKIVVDFFTDLPQNWEDFKTAWNQKWVDFKTNFKKGWDGFWDGVSDKMVEWKDNIVKTFEKFKTGLAEKVKNIKTSTINTFTKMGEGIGDIWTSIKDTTKQTWAGIWDVVKGFINLIIAGINKIIEAWNSLEFKLPKKTFNVFGKKVEFRGQSVGTRDIQRISPLATGGNVQSTSQGESQSILGNEALNKFGESIMNALQNSKEAVINLDGKKLGRAMIPILNNENSRTGSRTVIQTG